MKIIKINRQVCCQQYGIFKTCFSLGGKLNKVNDSFYSNYLQNSNFFDT